MATIDNRIEIEDLPKDEIDSTLLEEGKGGMLQLLPGVHETDGFFMARMKRKIRV